MKIVLVTVALLVALGCALTYGAYRRDLASARHNLLAGSAVASTACGPIEYAVAGSGPAVLLIHGAGGGYAQVSAFSRRLAASGFQAISMSRFGYLRTPLPDDASAEAQADAHACLLDALGIARAAAVGASAGAPSAMQFCVRHRERCSALVLLVPATHLPGRGTQGTTPPSPALQFVVDHVLTSDFVMWALTRLRPELLIETALATPVAVYRGSSPAERERALDMVRDIFPVGPKAQGLRNDARVCSSLARYDLERIVAPTLAISVEDDLFGTHASAQYTASQIRGAQFVSYPGGGHVWLGHDDEVGRDIVSFLRAATPGSTTP